MRLQLQTASTGTSTRRTATAASRNGASRRGTTRVNGPASLAPNGQVGRPYIGIYDRRRAPTRQRREAPVIDGRRIGSQSPCVRSADRIGPNKGGTAEDASVPREIGRASCRER